MIITLKELKNMRNTNTGPKFHRLGFNLVRYNTADVIRWQAHELSRRNRR